MDLDIGRDTLMALAAVAWADGKMEPREQAGIRLAAQQLRLGAEDLKLVEEAIANKVSLDQVETLRMNRLTRLFTYAIGAWIAHIDGEVPQAEQDALDLLGDRLGLSKVARERAQTAALGLAEHQGADFDVLKLRSRLSAGLSQIGNE
jgi:tellurite resistance protein